MNMIQKLKKNKKGFTLVELLVVLVILAILAAAIIPSMMGFIDKAKQESHAAECRSVILAAEVRMNELYGTDKLGAASTTYTFSEADITEITKIADLKGTISNLTATVGTDKHGVIATAKYVTDDKVVYDYTTTGGWVKADKKAA